MVGGTPQISPLGIRPSCQTFQHETWEFNICVNIKHIIYTVSFNPSCSAFAKRCPSPVVGSGLFVSLPYNTFLVLVIWYLTFSGTKQSYLLQDISYQPPDNSFPPEYDFSTVRKCGFLTPINNLV
ncbi:hypothetical protein GOODEAATRI_034661 [Goodea atripinnis]|uniref:Uncharacterized protein n=1 Tax=Goodea atripinnis TaxID=208336 RepID=A0ABV0PJE4_9TELE